MKKTVLLVVALLLVAALLISCTNNDTATEAEATTETAETSEEVAADSSENGASETAADTTGSDIPDGVVGKKIAVIINLTAGDWTQQFFSGATAEAEALGMDIDVMVSNGDDAKNQELFAQATQQGYDGIMVSHAMLSYCYDMVKPAIDKGIQVITIFGMPYEGADETNSRLEGVTNVSQDDFALAQQSLDSMIETVGTKPVKVLKTFMGPGFPTIDARDVIYKQYEEQGLIETVEVLGVTDLTNVRGDITNKLSALLPKYPADSGQVDAIWGCYDELAKGALQALNDAKRTDIKLFSIDISDDDINLMLENPDVWISTSACDVPQFATACVDIMALKLAGDPDVPVNMDETYDYVYPAYPVNTADLKEGTNMENLAEIVDGWAADELISDLNRPWMDTLRSQNK